MSLMHTCSPMSDVCAREMSKKIICKKQYYQCHFLINDSGNSAKESLISEFDDTKHKCYPLLNRQVNLS